MLKKIIYLLCILSFVVLAQNNQNYVEYSYKEGLLDASDKFNEGFGRYDGYTVPLTKGERIYLSVYSERFKPSLILVDPKGNLFAQEQYRGSDFLNMTKEIPESGDWIIYIVGNKDSEGKYLYQIAFASPGMSVLPDSNDVCRALDFILLHSNAYNVFLQGDQNIFRFAESEEAYIDGNDASYNNVYMTTNDKRTAELKFTENKLFIEECLGSKWEKVSRTWKENDEGFLIKYVEYSRTTGEDSYKVTIQMSDYTVLQEEGIKGYSVELRIIKVI